MVNSPFIWKTFSFCFCCDDFNPPPPPPPHRPPSRLVPSACSSPTRDARRTSRRSRLPKNSPLPKTSRWRQGPHVRHVSRRRILFPSLFRQPFYVDFCPPTVTVSPSGQFTTTGTLTFDRTTSGDPAAAAAAIISEGSAQSEVFTSTAGNGCGRSDPGSGRGQRPLSAMLLLLLLLQCLRRCQRWPFLLSRFTPR